MTRPAGAELAWRSASGLALAVGASASVAPRPLLRVFGVPADQVTPAAELGWRLFGIRTAVIAVAALRGAPLARRAILPVQVLDQAVFVHALTSGGVPRRTTLLAMATSGALILGSVVARRREGRGA